MNTLRGWPSFPDTLPTFDPAPRRPSHTRAEAFVGRQSEVLADPAQLRAAAEEAERRVRADLELVAPG